MAVAQGAWFGCFSCVLSGFVVGVVLVFGTGGSLGEQGLKFVLRRIPMAVIAGSEGLQRLPHPGNRGVFSPGERQAATAVTQRGKAEAAYLLLLVLMVGSE